MNKATPGEPIVLDFGQYSCKCGSNTDTPVEFPTERGLITRKYDMEQIYHHVFYNEMRSDPQEHPIVFTEPPLNTKTTREIVTATMFEMFEVPALYIAVQPVCALFSYGKTSGTVLDSGDGVTHSVSIYEGISMPHTVSKLDLGGKDLTDFIQDKIRVGNKLPSRNLCKIVRYVKEKLCYVSLNYRQDMDGPYADKLYELPDGKTITIGKDLFGIVEPLFNPSLLGMDSYGLHEMIFRSISKCDLDLKKEMFKNIVIAGGNTMFKGFSERLTNELNQIIPSMIDMNISDELPNRQHLTFKGANILAKHLMSMSKLSSDGNVESFSSSWILNEQYKEYGPPIVHRKCF